MNSAKPHPAFLYWPSSVASGLITLPPVPRPKPAPYRRPTPDLVLARQKELEAARLRLLVLQWERSGPHPFGRLKAYCHEHRVHYTTFCNVLCKVRQHRADLRLCSPA